MAPRINTGHDKGYKCVKTGCVQRNMILNMADVNDDNWTCKICGGPVHVKIINDDCRTIWTMRLCAKDVKIGKHQMYLPHQFDRAFTVKNSAKGTGKKHGHQWMLVLEGKGGTQWRMPDEYVDIDS